MAPGMTHGSYGADTTCESNGSCIRVSGCEISSCSTTEPMHGRPAKSTKPICNQHLGNEHFHDRHQINRIQASLNRPSPNSINGRRMSNGHLHSITTHSHDSTPSLTSTDITPPSPTQATAGMAIAICGMALRLPGGIHTQSEFWDLLVSGRDARSPVPASRYSSAGFSDALGAKSGDIKTQYGYFLSDDLAAFDAGLFTMGRSEVERADPQQRLLLEVVRECFDDAGEVKYRGSGVGCYVGTFGDSWQDVGLKETQHTRPGYVHMGYGDMMISNRVSYEYDLRGPSMSIKTGCSASLIALHEACRAIQNGDATGAIVAGTSLILSPTTTACFTAEGLISSDGSCKTFDSKANGFARAEAITAVYVKPLADALRDGNPVRAVIQATATNSDGRGEGILNPNGKAHEAMMRKIYHDARLDPGDTAFVECHGTGTSTGDPIEANAVGEVFGAKGVYIGSVKPNVGHSEGSSGITSLIKSVLALEHGIIPPNIKFESPNPKIPFAEKKLVVPLKPTPFPNDRERRISINSFGIGGANAHVIVDAYQTSHDETRTQEMAGYPAAKPELLLFSANSQSSLKEQVERYREFVKTTTAKPADLAYTLAVRREKLPHRAYAILREGDLSEVSGAIKAPTQPQSVYLVFNGQGGQWAGMAKELIQSDEAFRQDLLDMDDMLQNMQYPPTWHIIDELQKPEDTSRVVTAELSQPLCTAVQIALFNRLSAAGMKHAAAVGHSSGEIAAVYASGMMSMEMAIIVAYYRGFVTKNQPSIGAMAAVGLGADDVRPYLAHDVVVACENSPSSSTISGPKEKVLETVEAIKKKAPGVLARPLKVDMAYHSPLMCHMAGEYIRLIETEIIRRGIILASASSFVSSVSGELTEPPRPFGPEYWAANLTSPVRFSSSVSTLIKRKGDGIFLEIGPHSTLAGPLRQICSAANRPCEYVSSMVRGKNCVASLLSCFGKLFQAGIPINFSAVYPSGRVVAGLPTYAWDHNNRYWYESRVSKAWRSRRYPHHCLLGSRIPESPDTDPQWRHILHLDDEPWLADHKVKSDVVFPFAGYVSMAGEAARQMAGAEDGGYSLRHVVVQSALVLTESKAPEIITSLRKHMLTDNEESDWWEFTIASFTGSGWIMHSNGQVRAVTKSKTSTTQMDPLPRRVDMSRFYGTLDTVGISYGPEFRRLKNVTSSATETFAVGEVQDSIEEQKIGFVQHPALIDSCLQMVLVAGCKGLSRNLDNLAVPTCINELEVFPSSGDLTVAAWDKTTFRPNKVECVSGTQVIVRLVGMELTPLDDDQDDIDTNAAARLEWTPDIDFLDIAPLLEPPTSTVDAVIILEEMTLLCIIETLESVKSLEPSEPHHDKWRSWLEREVQGAMDGSHPIVKNGSDYLKFTPDGRKEAINERYQRLMKTEKSALAIGAKRICDNHAEMFVGHIQAIDILMQDEVLKELYNGLSFQHASFTKILAGTNPTLRILEVGAGTGSATATILPHLVKAGLPMYSCYTFTDISAGFFTQAKERFSYAPNMEYKVFDINKSPVDQGIDLDSYDLVVACNVVHATASLRQSLSNINAVLKPGGRLLLTEVDTVSRTPNYIFGNFSGWWLGEEDNREWEPFVPVERWNEELKASGYTGVDAVRYDQAKPYHTFAAIVAQRLRPVRVKKPVIVLVGKENVMANGLVAQLQASGSNASLATLEDNLPEDVDVISFLGVETNFFHDISEADFNAFQRLIKTDIKGKILWLTNPVQINCQSPHGAETIGVARTIRAERPLAFVTLEISTNEVNFVDLVHKVFNKIRIEEDANNLTADREYAIHNGTVCISRYHPFSLADEFATKSIENYETKQHIVVGKIGLLETLHWTETILPDLGPEQVEIEPHAVGLNFRDVLVAVGMVPVARDSETFPPGLEGSGIVTRLGVGVDNLAVGDKVMFLGGGGGLATRCRVHREVVIKKPDGLSFEEAATMPAVFLTVLSTMLHLGRLEKGQSVLIQAAAGGVGLGAIQVAKMVGAEIYATAGSEKKVKFLNEVVGIPRERIFNSRDTSFADGIMAATGGRGVDLVLNSASGELLHASWACVAEFGTLVDIAKRDMLGSGQLNMKPFLENRSYCGYDAKEVILKRPEVVGRFLRDMVRLYNEGQIHPMAKMTVFDESEVEQAFRLMQGGGHIGKIIIKLSPKSKKKISSVTAKKVYFDPDATYLLTGGFGGLGKSLITWMVERGAKYLTILSRSADSESSKVFIREVESMGCSVVPVVGRADEMADVEKAISMSTRPIKGVFHLAMVLMDGPMVNMSWNEWNGAIKPKVAGAWNLHNALKDQKLDIFWLASSLITCIEQPGQGNYSAANTFLEAFCQYRRSQGLPASALGICPVNGVGFVAENAEARRNCARQGMMFLGEPEFLDFVELSIVNSRPSNGETGTISAVSPAGWKNSGHVVMGLGSDKDLDDASNNASWRLNRRMGFYHNLKKQGVGEVAGNTGGIKAFLARTASDVGILSVPEKIEELAQEIGTKVNDFMIRPGQEVDTSLSMGQMGLDSLMAVELRRWFKQAMGLQISVLEIMGSGSLYNLAETAAQGLRAKMEGTG